MIKNSVLYHNLKISKELEFNFRVSIISEMSLELIEASLAVLSDKINTDDQEDIILDSDKIISMFPESNTILITIPVNDLDIKRKVLFSDSVLDIAEVFFPSVIPRRERLSNCALVIQNAHDAFLDKLISSLK